MVLWRFSYVFIAYLNMILATKRITKTGIILSQNTIFLLFALRAKIKFQYLLYQAHFDF